MGGPHHLFEVIGIELEYMIVDRDSLAVRPIADRLLGAGAGSAESEIEVGELAWSNELVLHVVELKTNGPAPGVRGLAAAFQDGVERINDLLDPMGARLMPTAMHPWMDPHAEMRLWPHEYNRVYETFHRIFDCRGHGWANLQSVHVNLPFAGDEEFGRLHAAVRMALPILPALAASSPLADGRVSGWLDTRLEFYRGNARRVPSVSGDVIPEPVYTRAAYEGELLARIYADLAPHDPEGVLRQEWVNARGCIARFDRSAIEIRVLDVAESPRVDLAIADAVATLVRALVEERFAPWEAQRLWPVKPLRAILLDTARDAGDARIENAAYLGALGCERGAISARELWRHLLDRLAGDFAGGDDTRAVLEVLVERGCLARRILDRLGAEPAREAVTSVYAELCDCLARGEIFDARA